MLLSLSYIVWRGCDHQPQTTVRTGLEHIETIARKDDSTLLCTETLGNYVIILKHATNVGY